MAFPPKQPVVVSAIVQRDDEIAFIRYAYGPWQGQWAFPSGFVDADEQPDVAAVRETEEEAGIVAEVEGLVSIMTMMWEGAPMLYLMFLARYVSGDPTPDGHEVDGAGFFGLDDLNGSDIPFENHNRWLARRILTGSVPVLRPLDSRHWHEMYRTSFI